MFNRSNSRARMRPVALGTAFALTVGAIAMSSAGAASAAPTDSDSTVASGDDWSVTRIAGGYEVDLTLKDALPVKDDSADVVVDGLDLGPGIESADGKTLSVYTTDDAVASAEDVTWQWSSGGNDTSTGPTTLAKTSAKPSSSTSAVGGTGTIADPSTLATGAFTTMDYNFGAQSIGLTNLGGVRGEMEGRIYLPTSKGAHPLVVFLHGRHSTCSATQTSVVTTTATGAKTTTVAPTASSSWPCPSPSTVTTATSSTSTTSTVRTTTGYTPILSYAGYDGAGESLAAAGYTVVSISVNSINANDGSLGADAGAAARGQAILDTLTMLKAANAGTPVSYHDNQYNTDYNLDAALAAGRETDKLASARPMAAADLVGTMDFSNIGLMGHSRGGEGAVTAATLNEGLANPWKIKSVFALAPIDFTRATLPDVVQTTLLPYCDGDVSDQQGQHFYADSRYAFDDDVLRSDIWVMGTDHNFYNTSWTPPYPGGGDDWSASNDDVCGTSDQALASGKNIRLTASQQYNVGTAYLSAFFELTLGGHTEFQSMFDGGEKIPASVSTFADVRTVAQAPSSKRSDITSFANTSAFVTTSTTATAQICASRFARTVPVDLPSCTSPTVNLTTGAQPYWTPASYAPNVPLNQLTHLTWTALSGSLTVALPQAKSNVSAYKEMTVSVSPDDSVTTATDMTVSVTDSAGKTWSSLLSALNPWTVTRMPGTIVTPTTPTGTASTLLRKLVLQQIHVPTATLTTAGLNIASLSKVTFTAASGADNQATTPATTTGGVYLQDLMFDSPALGTPNSQTRSTVNVASTKVEEGSAANDNGQVAVYLSAPSTKTSTAYLTVVGTATGKAGIAVRKVTFAPGETCKVVDGLLINGDTAASNTATTAFKIAVSDSTNAVLGINDFGSFVVREDDGPVTAGTAVAPAVGVQGDACAEFQALSKPGTSTVASVTPAPSEADVITAAGYRSGENVAVSIGDTVIGNIVASATGTISAPVTVPATQALGKATITATGSGSGFVTTAAVSILAKTAATVALSPAAPAIKQPVTLTAKVTGDSTTGGVVTFLDGTTQLGTAQVASGTASLALPGGLLAGTHAITARFEASATANTSTSAPVALTLVKGGSSIAVTTTAATQTAGSAITGSVFVNGATEGTVTVSVGGVSTSVTLGAGGFAPFEIPGTVPAGSYTLTAQYDGTDFVAASAVASQSITVTPAATPVAPTPEPTTPVVTTPVVPTPVATPPAVVVAPSKTSTTVILDKKTIKRGKTEKVRVTVAGPKGKGYVTGKVTLTITTHGVTKKKTYTLTKKNKGVISMTVVPSKVTGSASIKATFVGSTTFVTSNSAAKKVVLTK